MVKFKKGDRVHLNKLMAATVVIDFNDPKDGLHYVVQLDRSPNAFVVAKASKLAPYTQTEKEVASIPSAALSARLVRNIEAAAVAERSAPIKKKKVKNKFPNCPKRRWTNKEQDIAERAATKLTRTNLRKLRPKNQTAARAYLCPDCGGYHLTSQPWNTYLADLEAVAN